jgi:hypothetical protein
MGYLTAGRISCRKILVAVKLGLRENRSTEISSPGNSYPVMGFHAHPLSFLRGTKLYHRRTLLTNSSIASPGRPETVRKMPVIICLRIFYVSTAVAVSFFVSFICKLYCAGGTHQQAQ